MKLKRILAGIMTAALVITSVPVTGLGAISAQAAEEVTYEKVEDAILAENAFANSEQNPVGYYQDDGPASYAFNGNAGNWWHSRYEDWESAVKNGEVVTSGDEKATLFTEGGPTVYIGSSFGEEILLGRLTYAGRNSVNNWIGDFNLWVADLEDPSATPADADWKIVASSVEANGGEKKDKFVNSGVQTVTLNAPVKATHFKLEALGVAEGCGGDTKCVTASAIEVYKAVGGEEPQPAENERIYYPDENGEFNIPESDMAFFNSLDEYEISMAYRLTDVSQDTSAYGYALFTLQGEDGKYLTVRHIPERSDRAGQGDISYAYCTSINGEKKTSGTGLKFAKPVYRLNNTQWHKLTFHLNTTKMHVKYDADDLVWDIAAAFPQAGVVGSGNTYTSAVIGKKAEGVTYDLAGFSDSMQDFPGEIKYVKVTGAAYSAETLAKTQADILKKNADALSALLTECEGLTAESYTAASWAALETAKAAAEAATTEWAVLNATDDLKAALAALEEKPVEDTRTAIAAPSLSVTAPAAGAAPAEVAGDVYVPMSVVDSAENPVTLTSDNMKVFADAENGNAFSGQYTAEGSSAADSKLNVYGKVPFVVCFEMKTSQPAAGDANTQNIIGKMDNQWGVQVKSNVIQVYCNAAEGGWPTLAYTLPEGFDWDAWHSVKAVYNGSTFLLSVDGETPVVSDKTFSIPNTTNTFTIGYNATKSGAETHYNGLLRNMAMYAGEDIVIGTDATAESIQAAIADVAPLFKVTAMPESGVKPDYTLSTVWTNTEDGSAVEGNFTKADGYTVTATLQVVDEDAKKFTEDSIPEAITIGEESVTDFTATVAEDGKSMTISYAFVDRTTPEEKALEEALAAAAAIEGNGKTYTAESKKALDDAVTAAKALAADATAEEIQAAADAVQKAIENLSETWLADGPYAGEINITADSEEPTGEGAGNGVIGAAFDGNTATYWHSNWKGDRPQVEFEEDPESGLAVKLTKNNNVYIALAEADAINGISYVPRLKNGAMAENGAITKANVYVSKDSGATYELVAENAEFSYDGWNYVNDGAKTVNFETVEGVTNVKIEVLNTTSTQGDSNKNKFINAAEIGLLTPEAVHSDERAKAGAPNLAVTAPVAGAAPAEVTGDVYVPMSVVDSAENPVTLTSDNMKVFADAENGNAFSGQYTAEGSSASDSKLNVYGKVPFVVCFEMKTSQPAAGDANTQNIIGKMDNQWGVQVKSNVIQVYCNAAEGGWPTLAYTLPEGFDWDAWHSVKAVYNGSTFLLSVDGETPVVSDKTFSIPNTTNIFTIGYNATKSGAETHYNGLLRNVAMYAGEDIVIGTDATAESIQAAIADVAPLFKVTATPESGVKPDYTIKSTVWTDGNGDEVTAFRTGTDYTVTVTLEAKDGYKFTAPTSLPSVTVGGEKVEAVVEISDDPAAGSSIMTVSYTFPASEEEVAINNCLTQLIQYYGNYQESAETDIMRMLDALAAINETKAEEWKKITDYWRYINSDAFKVNTITYAEDGTANGVPEGLADDDSLCIVVLGFQLNPDGTMKDELIGRLEAAYAVAQAYPNAYVACTGGGTAADNPDATEADQMADYLINTKGISEDRVIVENKSKSTVQNAQFTYAILRESYPQVDDLCMVTSDYHVQRGSLLYFAKCLLSAYEAGDKELAVVSNAGYAAGHEGYESIKLQMNGVAQIAEISLGGVETPALSVVTDIEVAGIKAAYELGEEMGDLTVTASYDTNYSRDVSSKAVVSGFDKDTEGKQTVTVSYEENGTTVTKEFTVNVGDVSARIGIPTVTFTAPLAGEYPEVAAVTNAADAAHYEDIADRAENPEVFTKKNGASVAVLENTDGIWGFNDQLTGTSDGKFDIFGENPMIMSFKLYVKKTGNDQNCINIIGKMDNQYGFQLGADRLLLYMCNTSGGWPEQQYMVDTETFYNAWHDIILVIDGKGSMRFYVDGEASSKNEGHTVDDATAGHYSDPFTLCYNPKKDDSTMFTSEYGYLADIRLYTTDVSEGLTNDAAVIRNLLDAETPVANITATPYDTKTTWSVTGGDALDGKAAFGEHTGYTATTVLTAHEGFSFGDVANDVKKAAEAANPGAEVTAVVGEGGKTLTVTAAFAATEEIACTCGVALTVKATEKIKLDEKYTAKTQKLTASAAATGGCKVEGHPQEAEITYEVTKGADLVSVDAEGLVTAKTVGEAEITVTAKLPKKDGEEPAVDSKVIKVTVDSTRAAEGLVADLETEVAKREEEIAGDKEKTYTKASVQALKDAIAAAKTLLESKPAISETEVNKKLNALKAVTLSSVADQLAKRDELGKLIDEANEKIKSKKYTVATAQALATVNTAAVELYNTAAVDIEAVKMEDLEKACEDLQKALNALVTKEDQEKIDKQAAQAEMKTVLAEIEKLISAGQGNYTDATWQALTKAYEAAKAGMANGTTTSARLKELAAALTTAQKALVKSTTPVVKNGYVEELASGRYQVISTSKKTAKLVQAKNKKKSSIGVPAMITIQGVKYKVVQVGPKAFKGFKNLKKITLSKNITTVGKQAFAGCKKLSCVVVKGTALKNIKSGAFKQTSKKMKVIFKSKKVKASKRAALLKKMKKAGMSKSAKLK